jgi:putative ABC transport system ATP-binding protein
MKDDELSIFRRRNIGFVFQSYNLVPVLNAEENILLPVHLDGNKPDKDFTAQIIETLGLEENGRVCQTSFPEAGGGGWQSPAPWRPSLPLYWRTNRLVI